MDILAYEENDQQSIFGYFVQNSLMLMRGRWNELTILSPQECLDYNLITITIDEERHVNDINYLKKKDENK